MDMNPYTILNIDKKASKDEIRKAYIKLAMKYHPDKNKNKSIEIQNEYEEKFKEINNAYNELLNGNISSGDSMDSRNYTDVANRIFKEAKLFGKYFFDIVQDVAEHINVNLKIDIFDIYNNIEKEFSLDIKRKCKKCMGIGINIINKKYETCNTCLGEKYKLTNIMFKINSGEGKQIFFKKSHEEYGKRTGNVIINIIPKNMQTYKIINTFDLLYYVYKPDNNKFKHFDNKTYTINTVLKPNIIYSIKEMGLYDNDLQRGDLCIQYLQNKIIYNIDIDITKN